MESSDKPQESEQARLRAIDEALRTRYWCWTLLTEHEAPLTLLQLLVERLPHVPAHSWDSRFEFGGIYINGLEAVANQRLPIPCRVEYYEPKFDITTASLTFPEFRPEYILYRDKHIVVAFKPPGLSSMPAKEQRHFSVKASVEKILEVSVHMPSRLDVSAQGILVMSISPEAHADLQKAFESRRVSKTYVCASARMPCWSEKTVSANIGRDPLHPVLRRVCTSSGQPAETIFRYLGEFKTEECLHILSAHPITGRTHQIRVHAAHEGIPLVGDRFYGGAPEAHLHLVSFGVSCTHPVSKQPFSFALPLQLQPDWMQRVSGKLTMI